MTFQEIYSWSIGIGVSWLTYDLIVSAMLALAPMTGEGWKWTGELVENGHRFLTRLLRAEGRETADVRDTVDRKVKAPDEEDGDWEEERQMDGWGLYIATRISSKVTTFRKGVEFAVNITRSLVRKRRASAKIW